MALFFRFEHSRWYQMAMVVRNLSKCLAHFWLSPGAIFAFQSLNKLGPLVADHKTGYRINAYMCQDKSIQVPSNSDKKQDHFSYKNLNCAYPLSNASLKK